VISAKGGVSNGVRHGWTSGLAERTEASLPGFLTSKISSPSIDLQLASYITRWGFFGPFALDTTGLFIEIAA
jgi:hypothetical protein